MRKEAGETYAVRQHALLSASGAKRWLSCPPSARLELNYEDKSSEYAEEGTLAHAVAEAMLGAELKELGYLSEYDEPEDIPEEAPDDMIDIIKDYCDEVITHIASMTDPCVMLEQRFSYGEYVPEGFGTGDVVAVSDGTVQVIDLKYGKGEPVSANENPQLMLYGLGAYLKFNDLYDIKTVKMTIMQPRLDSISTYELASDELLNWAENTVKPIAEMAYRGEGEFKAGDHCRFCKARYECRVRAEENLKMAQYEFAPPPTLEPDEIAEILSKAEELEKWSKEIREYALEQARDNNVIYKGWKLVEGRSVRKFTDEKNAKNALKAHGLKPSEYQVTKLKGITELTKLLGAKGFDEILGSYVIKPPGSPVLVKDTDKRPPLMRSAEDDFKQED